MKSTTLTVSPPRARPVTVAARVAIKTPALVITIAALAIAGACKRPAPNPWAAPWTDADALAWVHRVCDDPGRVTRSVDTAGTSYRCAGAATRPPRDDHRLTADLRRDKTTGHIKRADLRVDFAYRTTVDVRRASAASMAETLIAALPPGAQPAARDVAAGWLQSTYVAPFLIEGGFTDETQYFWNFTIEATPAAVPPRCPYDRADPVLNQPVALDLRPCADPATAVRTAARAITLQRLRDVPVERTLDTPATCRITRTAGAAILRLTAALPDLQATETPDGITLRHAADQWHLPWTTEPAHATLHTCIPFYQWTAVPP